MSRKSLLILVIILSTIVLAFKFQLLSDETTSNINPDNQPSQKTQTINYAHEIAQPLNQFSAYFEDVMQKSGTIGAAVVITYKGEVVLTQCYGVRKAGTQLPVNEHTVFRLASVSKSVTGVLAALLDNEKLLPLNTKISDYLPQVQLKNREYTKMLEAQHLLSHTTGLVPHAYDLMVEDQVPFDKIIERLDEVEIASPPGKLYGYQNVMFSIYAPLVKAVTGKSFSSFMEEKVFSPFNMTDASLSFEDFVKHGNFAVPHFNRGHNSFSPLKLNDRYYITAPAAGVNASISDMGNLLSVLTDNHNNLLPERTKNKLFTPLINSPLNHTYFRSWGRKVKNKRYALGWRIVDYQEHTVAYHAGYVTGYKSEIAVCPDEQIGIAILCNSPNNETAKIIPWFLNELFEYQQEIALNPKSEEKPNS